VAFLEQDFEDWMDWGDGFLRIWLKEKFRNRLSRIYGIEWIGRMDLRIF
jgi:hypothetical protein